MALLPSRASAAVSISSFTVKWQGNQVVIAWVTATETQNRGFNILRSTTATGTFTKVNSKEIATTTPPGSLTGSSYSYTDTPPTIQTLYYKLQSVDRNGVTQDHNAVMAAPSAAPTATATKVAPTSTSTLTPVPSSTPTVTPTYPPGVTPPTAAPTFTPQATPTRTQTYPPGVKPPTAAPSPTQPRIAQAQPIATAQPNVNVVVPTVSTNDSISDSSSAMGAAPSTDTPPDEPSENSDNRATDQNSTMNTILRLGVIALSGAMGLGALVFGALAVILFIRFTRNGS